MSLVGWVLIGVVIGVLARLVFRARWALPSAIAGALVGGLIGVLVLSASLNQVFNLQTWALAVTGAGIGVITLQAFTAADEATSQATHPTAD